MKSIIGVSIIAAIAMGWAATMTIPAATITPDEATLKLLPPETEAVAFIDVAALRSAPLVQDAMANKVGLGLNRELGEFMMATGFDPQRDLDNVTIAKIGVQQVLVIAEAQYDRFKVEQFVKDKSAGRISSEAYLGRTIYAEGDKAFSLIDNLVILGESGAVKKVIDQMTLPGSLPLRADLMGQIKAIEAGSQVWAAGDFSIKDLPGGLRGPAPAMDMMKSLRRGTYQMRVDRGIHAKAAGHFDDADAAKNLADMARGFVALVKLQVAKEQDLLHLLDGIQVSNSGTSVVVNIDEPGDLLKKLETFRGK